MRRSYEYVGDPAIRERALREPGGARIESAAGLAQWIAEEPTARREGATFVVTVDGALWLAPRRSEHVGCARGAPVLAAGELRFVVQPRGAKHEAARVCEASNQSTGYCPEPDSFAALASALDAIGVARPAAWTHVFVFRRCPRCAQLALVKDAVFECVVCGAPLPT